ncbi:MAG: sugar phosphate nucleotidyltransferase [Patescibacteria group bacterium]|nr:sugar phosphate nucleotidyltransferase [Patescibacteria group bacterium]
MSTTPTPKVTKAVIAAAGFGTRFLPQTKAMPKEMLPLIDKPIIQYVVEELVAAGIKDIIIISGSNKRSIEDHFDTPNQDLVSNLQAGGAKKEPLLREVEAISNMANFIYVRQKGPYGNATPVACASHLIGNEPFIYTFADDFFKASPGRTQQLIAAHTKYGGSILACKRVEDDAEYDRYGFAAGESLAEGIIKVNQIVEKPGKAKAPSAMASVSGYLLTPHIFSYIEDAIAAYDGGELMIQPIMQTMIDDGLGFHACEIANGTYYDTGDKLEYLKTAVAFALERDDIGPELLQFLRKKLQ